MPTKKKKAGRRRSAPPKISPATVGGALKSAMSLPPNAALLSNLSIPKDERLSPAAQAEAISARQSYFRDRTRHLDRMARKMDKSKSDIDAAMTALIGPRRAREYGRLSGQPRKQQKLLERARVSPQDLESKLAPLRRKAGDIPGHLAVRRPDSWEDFTPWDPRRPYRLYDSFWYPSDNWSKGPSLWWQGGNGEAKKIRTIQRPQDGVLGSNLEFRYLNPGDNSLYVYEHEVQMGDLFHFKKGRHYRVEMDFYFISCHIEGRTRNEPYAFSGGMATMFNHATFQVGAHRAMENLAFSSTRFDFFEATKSTHREVIRRPDRTGEYEWGRPWTVRLDIPPFDEDGSRLFWIGLRDSGAVQMNDFEAKPIVFQSIWKVHEAIIYETDSV